MTKKEARNLLNNSRPKGNNAYSIMLNEALDMAVEALEQEPREAQWIYNNDDDTITCSNCQTWFTTTARSAFMRYCPYCGRKIKSEVRE